MLKVLDRLGGVRLFILMDYHNPFDNFYQRRREIQHRRRMQRIPPPLRFLFPERNCAQPSRRVLLFAGGVILLQMVALAILGWLVLR